MSFKNKSEIKAGLIMSKASETKRYGNQYVYCQSAIDLK